MHSMIHNAGGAGSEPLVDELRVFAFEIPTETPESDGTLQWSSTTLVLVLASSGDLTGIGYTYADRSTARFIESDLASEVKGRSAMDVAANWRAMCDRIRNLGRSGVGSMAISAVDCALWDLKARLLGLPLLSLFGAARRSARVYGSGGFTSQTDDQLREQLGGWAECGLTMVKMKVGREPGRDPHRTRVARKAIGDDVDLFVDANGAFHFKDALRLAERLSEANVSWFEEPVPSDDLTGLRLMRERGPAGMSIAAGEYGYESSYFRRMLEAQAVDVLQADATRCGGFTEFLRAGALCEAFGIELSSHTAPALHLHAACAIGRLVHMEYFSDHVRIEQMAFDGVRRPTDGRLIPDLSRPGMGLEPRMQDLERWRVA